MRIGAVLASQVKLGSCAPGQVGLRGRHRASLPGAAARNAARMQAQWLASGQESSSHRASLPGAAARNAARMHAQWLASAHESASARAHATLMLWKTPKETL